MKMLLVNFRLEASGKLEAKLYVWVRGQVATAAGRGRQ